MFELDPSELGYTCEDTWYFSYAGAGPGAPRRDAACPVRTGSPYTDADTQRPLDELVETFRSQVGDLPAPVVVVAHSQGGWVAAAALDGRVAERVTALVLLGGFAHANRGYVLDGSRAGLVGTDTAEVIVAAARRLDLTSFDPRGALARAVLAVPREIDELVRDAHRSDARVITVRSAFDLPLVPAETVTPGPLELCPFYVHHSDLPTSDAVLDRIAVALGAERLDTSCPWWRRWPMRSLEPFGAPP